MTYGKKEILKYPALLGNTWKVLGCLGESLISGSKVGQLTEIDRANAIASSIFFVRDIQAPILGTTYRERSS